MPRPYLAPGPFAFAAVVVFALDQATKLAMLWAGPPSGPVPVIDGLVALLYRENRGGAWGLLSGTSESFAMPFFVVTSVLAIAFLFYLRHRMPVQRPRVDVAFAAVLGGAVGNLVDRVRLGRVIDFLDVDLGFMHWPTFNVADMGITVGVLVLVGDSLFPPRSTARSRAEPPEPAG